MAKYIANSDVMPLKALLDPQGKAVTGSMKNLGLPEIENVRIGKHITLEIEAGSKDIAHAKVDEACKKLKADTGKDVFAIHYYPTTRQPFRSADAKVNQDYDFYLATNDADKAGGSDDTKDLKFFRCSTGSQEYASRMENDLLLQHYRGNTMKSATVEYVATPTNPRREFELTSLNLEG